ncbi:MAG: hypothetical protein AB7T49_13545 [Oligoflexales bacterium]
MQRKALIKTALFLGLAASSVGYSTILPPNNLHLQDSLFAQTGISEEEFNNVLTYVESVYAPIFESHNAKFVVERAWTDPTVNAYAEKQGTNWVIHMFGGLARRPEVTSDGFALVACHEIGHHLGGFPFYFLSDMSVEGEADYFATHSCARLLWSAQLEENAKSRETVLPAAKAVCDAQFTDEADQNLCYRTAMGGVSLAGLLGALGGTPNVDITKPSKVVVSSTMQGHPPAQCRLDTYVNGGLCVRTFDELKIPKNWTELKDSSCTAQDGSTTGIRPRCWFKPNEL